MKTIDQLKEELKAKLKAASEIAGKAEDEGRDFTDEERADVQANIAAAQDLKSKIVKSAGDGALRQTLADLGDDIGIDDEPKVKRSPAGLIVADGKKTLGQHYTESGEFKQLLETVPGGHFSKEHRVQARPVGFSRLLAPGRGAKALVTGASDTSAGAFVVNDNLGLQVGLTAFERPLTLRDLVTNGTTGSDTVEYVQVTSVTNNAAPVAEATSSAAPTAPGTVPGALVLNAGGGYKPESAMAVAKVTTPVRTLAHWIPATKRALSDAAQIRTLIDNFLQYGLEEELEDQMISGDGTGENFDGIGHISGTQSQAWNTDLLTTTRKAKTLVRTVGRSIPTGYVLNPSDLEALDLLKDNEGRYYFGGPSGTIMSAPVLWNLPVIESEAVPAGVGYVGDWRKAILWDREQASITMTDTHADFFIRNLVAILAEMRAAFGVIQPSAFVEIDLTA
jgi:HK97 family phage major capsid protein